MFGSNKRNASRKRAPEGIDLDVVIAGLGQATNFWDGQPHADILSRTRLADSYRDAGWNPVTGRLFDSAWQDFNAPQQLRFCLLSDGLTLPDVLPTLSRLNPNGGEATFLQLQQLTVNLRLLDLDVLCKSDVRLEEFARHFLAAFGLKITGESAEGSAQRLHDIDFARLMQEAEAARHSAEDRMAYLRELQEKENETRRPRRGKW